MTKLHNENDLPVPPIKKLKPFEKWTDEEFITACEWLNNLPLYSTGNPYHPDETFPKYSFIYDYHAGKGLFCQGQRLINGKEYSFGLKPSLQEVHIIGNYYIQRRSVDMCDRWLKNTKLRLARCTDIYEREALITHEIEWIRLRVENSKDHKAANFNEQLNYQGYSTIMARSDFTFYNMPKNIDTIVELVQGDHFDEKYLFEILQGAIDARLEIELKRLLADIKSSGSSSKKPAEAQKLQLSIIGKKKQQQRKKGNTAKENSPQIFKDTWVQEAKYLEHYNKVIAFLKEYNIAIGRALVVEGDGKIVWPKIRPSGRLISAFLYLCYENGFIKKDYPAQTWQNIMQNTFGNKFDINGFKSPRVDNFEEEHLAPFKQLPKLK